MNFLRNAEQKLLAAKELNRLAKEHPELVLLAAKEIQKPGKHKRVRTGSTDDIKEYLRANGESAATDVVAALKNSIKTSSKSPDKMIRTILAQLEKAEKVTSRVHEGRKMYALK